MWILVFLIVVSLVVLSYYAENGKAYSAAQLPSARTDGTSSSSRSSSPGGLLVLVSLLALLDMVTLIAAVAIKRRWIEMEDTDSPTVTMALTVQTWIQIGDVGFDVPIPATMRTPRNQSVQFSSVQFSSEILRSISVVSLRSLQEKCQRRLPRAVRWRFPQLCLLLSPVYEDHFRRPSLTQRA